MEVDEYLDLILKISEGICLDTETDILENFENLPNVSTKYKDFFHGTKSKDASHMIQ